MKPVALAFVARALLPPLLFTALSAAAAAAADDAPRLRQRALAANCAHCHGTDGRAVAGEAIPALAGQPRDRLLELLLAFRSGQRPATVMHQISRGYTPQQLDDLAEFFSRQTVADPDAGR